MIGGGRVKETEEGVVWMGQVRRSCEMRDWAQVRAVRARVSLVGFGGRGEEERTRREPRSKVGGMGAETVVVVLGGFSGCRWGNWGGAYELVAFVVGFSIAVFVSIAW